MKTEYIKTSGGKITHVVTTHYNGDKSIAKFAGPILGTWYKSTNEVKRFAGPVVGYGEYSLGTLLS